MTASRAQPVCVFVDPSAGAKGLHNLAFVQQLQQFGASGAVGLVELGLAHAGVAVLPVFEVDGYQLTGKPIAPNVWTPYVATWVFWDTVTGDSGRIPKSVTIDQNGRSR